MKKVVLAFIVCVTSVMCAKANLVKWSFGTTASGAYKSTAANLAGFTAYLMLASDWNNTSASLTSAVASSSLTATISTSVSRYSVATTESATTLATGDYSSYFVVVISDGSSYWASAAKDGTSYVAGSTSPVTPVSITLSGATAITDSMLSSFSAVPEPASVGLLMLGLCALGLKRKIA